MSIEATLWALNLAPVPIDASKTKTSPSSSCAFVLLALANHADPEGRDAFPAVDTIVRYTRLSERTIRTCLDRLEAEGIIRPGDPDVVAAKIKRGDRRPNGYDLAVERVREDLSDDELVAIAKSNPLLRPFIAGYRPDLQLHLRGAAVAPRMGEPVLRGATAAPREETADLRGAAVAPRRGERGATGADGVQPLHSRGAAAAPEPSLNPPTEPNYVTSTSERDVDIVDNPVDNASPAIEVLWAERAATATSVPALDGGFDVDDTVPEPDLDFDEVERTLVHLPERLRPTLGEALRLRGLIEQRMKRGWTREEILFAVQQRFRDGGSLTNPCGLFAKVLVPLDGAPNRVVEQSRRGHLTIAKPWCGECDKETRRPLDDQGFPDLQLPKCRECERLEFEDFMTRGAS